MAAFRFHGATVETVLGDIVQCDVDAVVNAANSELLQGGGVCGAIFRAAGAAELQRACARVVPCPTGDARITPGFNLRARHVIHAVGPMWRGGGNGEPEQLAGAYQSALRLAAREKLHSIAFPAISTGIYGYPLEQAIPVAAAAITAELSQPDSPRTVLLVLRDAETQRRYDQVLGGL